MIMNLVLLIKAKRIKNVNTLLCQHSEIYYVMDNISIFYFTVNDKQGFSV